MKKILLVLLMFFPLVNYSQMITFQKTIGTTAGAIAHSIQQTSDGGYILTGRVNGIGAGTEDVYLVKTNSNGDTIWTKTFGGIIGDEGNYVQQTSDGGYIIVGYTNSFGAGNSDVYLLKIDSTGILIWSKAFGGTGYENANEVHQTSDGGYVIVGYTSSYGAGGNEVYLIKTNSIGTIIWTKTYGKSGEDEGASVQQTSDGGYIVAASSTSFRTGNFYHALLIKTDVNGNIIWQKLYSGLNSDYLSSVQQTADGGFVAAGTTSSFGAGGYDVFVFKTNNIGTIQWAKTFGANGSENAQAIKQTLDRGYIITGACNSFGIGTWDDVYLIKTDSTGNSLWAKTYGSTSEDFGYSVCLTSDSGFALTGQTFFGTGNTDIYFIKTDMNGISGCNESNRIMTQTSPNIVVTSISALISSGAITNTPSTITQSGGIINSLCFQSVMALNLRVFIQGLYLGGNIMRATINPSVFPLLCDTIVLELHNANAPYNLITSLKSTVNTNGLSQFVFPSSIVNHSYYLALKNRNTVETWSKNPLLFTGSSVNYDFTK